MFRERSGAPKRSAARANSMLLKRFKRWLGWDTESGLPDFGEMARSRPAEPAPKAAASRPADQGGAPRRKTERAPLDVLDNPRLTLNKPVDDGFDPYNTGAFNRSASWERIGRQRKR
jgi:hypothetical protein